MCDLLQGALYRRLHSYPDDRLVDAAVVFSPHQDDETLGCGGTIIRKCAAGAPVSIVFMTDGATSHRRLLAPEKMRGIRRQEALAAAGLLGVAAGDVVFLDHPNRELHASRQAAVAAVKEILAERRPREIFMPYRAEAPSDHHVTNEVVRAALAESPAAGPVTVLEYPVWFWQHWPWSRTEIYGSRAGWRAGLAHVRAGLRLLRDFRCGVPVADVLDRKREALARHTSQMTRLVDDPRWQTLADVSQGEWLGCFFGCYELFCTYTVPNDPAGRQRDFGPSS